MKTSLSKPAVSACIVLAAMGFVYGITSYVERPASYAANDPANNAIALHVLLAVLAAAAVACVQYRRAGKRLPSVWLMPVSSHAFERLHRTFTPRPFGLMRFARMLAAIPLLYTMSWQPFRAAMQVVAGLDPAFTANAWGGRSYWGALLAHWLDGAIVLYACAWLLHLVLARTR